MASGSGASAAILPSWEDSSISTGKPATVVGVTPYAFASLGGQRPDIWMPIAQQPYFVEGSHTLTDPATQPYACGAGWRLASARRWPLQELRTLTNELRRQHPQRHLG
jgi:hypothetical protein